MKHAKPSRVAQLVTLCKLLAVAAGTIFAIWLIDVAVTPQ